MSEKARETPEQALDRFVADLNKGDLRNARAAFVREGCFVTPDATEIRGRESIGRTLAQLISVGVMVQLNVRRTLHLGGVALVSDHWTTVFRDGTGSELRQGARGTTILKFLEARWRVLLVAPWGWADQVLDLPPHTVLHEHSPSLTKARVPVLENG